MTRSASQKTILESTASPHGKTRNSISSKAILLVRTNVATANGLYIIWLKKAAAAANTMTTNRTTAISIPPALKTMKEYRTFWIAWPW